jgi:thiol-disulfide isomerase/thioredoxin
MADAYHIMKRNTLIATLALSLATLGSAFAGGEGWVTDFEAAKKAAAEGKKDLLLDFTGSDWCPPCMRLTKEVLGQKTFVDSAKEKFVLVELDFPRKKEIDPKLKEQNDKLQEEYQITGYPTIMLCDASGKPYAKTGFRQGGPEAYMTHLSELQAIRVKRDEAFAKADSAKSDAEKAAFLVEGLKLMDEELVDSKYADVVKSIGELDKEDKTGFVKARKEVIAKKEAAAKAEAALEKFSQEKISPLMEAKEFDKALAEVKTFIKENPGLPEDYKVMMTMQIGLAGPLSTGNLEAANALVDELAKDYPDSMVGKNADKIKASVKERVESMKPKAPKTEEGAAE